MIDQIGSPSEQRVLMYQSQPGASRIACSTQVGLEAGRGGGRLQPGIALGLASGSGVRTQDSEERAAESAAWGTD
jgi:hypothetical protein